MTASGKNSKKKSRDTSTKKHQRHPGSVNIPTDPAVNVTACLTSNPPLTELPAMSTPKSSAKCTTTFMHRSQQWIDDWIKDWWGIELLSWMISAASLCATYATLEYHKGKTLSEWSFLITLNSLLSIFATVGQMAMMKPVVECLSQLKWLWFIRKSKRLNHFQSFDDASRGPTGSLALLGKLGGLHLASLGAAITVIAIAFGPVSQQVVTYPLHLNAVGNASLPRAVFFTVNEATASSEDLSPDLTAALEDSFGRAILTPSAVIPDCNTGNCTWDEYSSLGVCASTTDISSRLINNTCNTNALNRAFEVLGTINPGYPCYNYSLPLFALNTVPKESPVPGYILSTVVWENATLTSVNPPISLDSVGMMFLSLSTGFNNDYSLVDINVLYQPGIENSINSSLPAPIALECSLHLCIQTFTTKVSQSKTTTSLISSQFLNTTSIIGSAGNTTIVANGTTFGVNSDALFLFQNNLSGYLSDFCSFIDQPGNETFTGGTINFCYSTAATAFLNKLQGSKNYVSAANSIMENMAISLSNSFRSGGGENLEIDNFEGTAYLPVTFIDPDYIWLTLPIGLVLLTLVFLLATISQSQRLGAKNWKSSNFPILQGLHADIHNELGGLVSPSDMEKKVDDLEVRLNIETENGEKENGWKFVKSK